MKTSTASQNGSLVGQIVSVAALGTTHLALVTEEHPGHVVTVDRWGGQSRSAKDSIWTDSQRRASLRSSYTDTPAGEAAYLRALEEFELVNLEARRAIENAMAAKAKAARPQELKLNQPQHRLRNGRTGLWYVKGGNFTAERKSQAAALSDAEAALVQAQYDGPIERDSIVLENSVKTGKRIATQAFIKHGAVYALVRVNRQFAEITPESGRAFFIPVEMLGLAAGKDEWMRRIMVRCADCGKRVPAGEMECRMCEECYDRSGEENAKLDAGD